MKPLMKLLIGITLGILLGASVDAAVGTFTFKTPGASDTVEAVSLVYPQRVPEAGSVTTGSIADGSVTPAKLSGPIPVANGGTGATTAAAGLANLGTQAWTAGEKTQALVGSSSVDFLARNISSVGTQSVDLGAGVCYTGYFSLANGGTITTKQLIGGADNNLGILEIVAPDAVCFNSAFIHAGLNAVTGIASVSGAISDQAGALCIISSGSGVYTIKNNLGSTLSFVYRYIGRD